MPQPGGPFAAIHLPVETPRLTLRLPQYSDVPTLVRYFRDPRVTRPVVLRHKRFTRADEVAFVTDARRAAVAGRQLNLAIALRSTGEHIGGIGLEILDHDNRVGWLGYWLAPQHWHRAYGSEVASAMCTQAFERLDLHRIDAAVFAFNPRSMQLLRRLGFRREGVRRETLERDRRRHDEVIFGLLRSEFRPFVVRPATDH